VIVTTLLSLSVAYFSFKKFVSQTSRESAKGTVAAWSQNKFYVDELYQFLFLKPLSALADLSWKLVDKYIINGFLHFLRDGMKFSGQLLSFAHTGNVQTYAWYLAFASAMALMISWWVLR
jgi:NADH-quinone oxidoreductase subunit L